MRNNLPVPHQGADKALIDRVAAEIGTDLLHYLTWAYPAVFAAMNGGCKVSVRNHVRSDIASAIKCQTAAEYEQWILDRRAHRRRLNKIRKINEDLSEEPTT